MRRYRSESEWAAIVEEYATSGKSRKAFCREREVSESSIYRRIRKGKQQSGEFIELPHARSLTQYEVCVKGVTIRIPANERVARIAELVRALGC
jgi:transposase-like protein